MNFISLTASWAALATVVLALALYRRIVANKEDDCLHVTTDVAAQQISVARKLEAIDRWGKVLTVVVVIAGIALLGLFLYNGWVNPPKID